MTFHSLKLFRDLAQYRSVSKAAEASSISQSAASQQLQDLEQELGVALADRSKRPLVITAAGQLFAEFCRNTLREKEELQTSLAGLNQVQGGTVRVASIYSIGLSEMAQLEKEFSLRFPHAKLEVNYLRPDRVFQAVLQDQADLGLLSYAEPTREMAAIPWRKEEMILAAAPDHPLARRAAALAGPLPTAELNGADFVAFDDDLPIRTAIDKFLKECGVQVNEAVHFDNVQMIKEAVALKVGVSILPARLFREEVRQRRLAAIRIAGANLYRPLGIIHRKKKVFAHAAQAFLDLLRQRPVPEPAAAP